MQKRDLSKTLPRFRDPANIFRYPRFSRYHSPPLMLFLITIVNRLELLWKAENINGAAQPFAFCSQIMTEYFNATFLLANKIKFIGMLLNVVNRRAHKRRLTGDLTILLS